MVISVLVLRHCNRPIWCGNSKPISLKPTQDKGIRQLVFALLVVAILVRKLLPNFPTGHTLWGYECFSLCAASCSFSSKLTSQVDLNMLGLSRR